MVLTCELSDNELKFVNAVRENLFIQHTDRPARQRGTDTAHTLDLVLSVLSYGICLPNIKYRSLLGLSDHSVLSLSCQLHVDNVCTSNKFRWDKGDYSTLQ